MSPTNPGVASTDILAILKLTCEKRKEIAWKILQIKILKIMEFKNW